MDKKNNFVVRTAFEFSYPTGPSTAVVNCSMGKQGEGALIELNKDISIQMIDYLKNGYLLKKIV